MADYVVNEMEDIHCDSCELLPTRVKLRIYQSLVIA